MLGPLLWNLPYDTILWTVFLIGVNVLGYAEDTLVHADWETFESTSLLAELGVAYAVGWIFHERGLQIASNGGALVPQASKRN